MPPFHAHHPAFGAGASLLAGLDGADCLLHLGAAHAMPMGLFVGIRQAPTLPWRMLPLFANAPDANEPFEVLTPGRYGRTFALASDRWLIGPLVFKLCTPFWRTSDPASCDRETLRLHFTPSIGGFIEYDNTHSDDPVEVIVGAGGPLTAFEPAGPGGFLSGDRLGFATAASGDVRLRLGASPFDECIESSGDYGSLVFRIPAATKRIFPLAIGLFDSGAATSLAPTLFADVADVLASALINSADVIRRADELDTAWFGSALSREAKLTLALAVREHLALTNIRKTPDGWMLARPANPTAASFETEFFPWSNPSGPKPSGSWLTDWV